MSKVNILRKFMTKVWNEKRKDLEEEFIDI